MFVDATHLQELRRWTEKNPLLRITNGLTHFRAQHPELRYAEAAVFRPDHGHDVLFDGGDVGCWVAASNSRENLILALELVTAFCPVSPHPSDDPLWQPPSDNLAEEVAVLEALQEHTDDGLVWLVEAGELLLVREDWLNGEKAKEQQFPTNVSGEPFLFIWLDEWDKPTSPKGADS